MKYFLEQAAITQLAAPPFGGTGLFPIAIGTEFEPACVKQLFNDIPHA